MRVRPLPSRRLRPCRVAFWPASRTPNLEVLDPTSSSDESQGQKKDENKHRHKAVDRVVRAMGMADIGRSMFLYGPGRGTAARKLGT